MTAAPPPGWDPRTLSDNTVLWRYRPGWLTIDLTLHRSLQLAAGPGPAVVLCASPWFRFIDPAALRTVAAAINQAADWLETAPRPDAQLTLDSLEANGG